MIREKRTTSGPLLEIDIYPIWNDGRKMPSRAPKSKPTTETQAKYNEQCAKKKIVRLVNANFNTLDYFAHPTYRASEAPGSEEEARRDMNNFLRRVKRRREKELEKTKKQLLKAKEELAALPTSVILSEEVKRLKTEVKHLRRPFKYIYAIEKVSYKSGRYAGRDNWHFHLFVTGGLSAKVMQNIWTQKRGITDMNLFRPDIYGADAAALYIVKDPQGRKRFAYSKNLKQPKELKHRDGRLNKKDAERIAKERIDDRAFWEKKYKGYRFVRCFPRYNEWNGHWYISTVMYKNDREPPLWNEDEWNTEFIQ